MHVLLLTAPHLYYHVTIRGIEKRAIFRQKSDYLRFLKINNGRIVSLVIPQEP